MLRLFVVAMLAFGFLPFASAHAAASANKTSYQPVAAPSAPSWQQPDLISFSAGWVDFDKDEKRTQSADFRGEYRWGKSWLGSYNDWMSFGIDPLVGLDVSTRSQIYGFGGFAFDLIFWKHFVVTESEAVGLFDSGDAKPLGSFIEFRSQAEVGYRFDNDMRLTAEISHISNAGLTKRNPGEEIAGFYVHVPVSMLFGQ